MKKILWLLILICTLVQPVSAHEVPDLTKQGSIHIAMRYDGKPVSGGELTLYRVGDIVETDGNYGFVPTEQFLSAEVSFEKVHAYETAKKLASFASKEKPAGMTEMIDEKGTAAFENLKPGLYLIVQNKAAKGYDRVSPFLTSLPMRAGDTYSYNIDASPKISPITKQPAENTEQPKTGQSGWPIWIFTLSGAALIVLLRRRETA